MACTRTQHHPQLRALLCGASQDFLARLPLPELTDPRQQVATLNLATCLKPQDNPPDLGPKVYMAATWRPEESDGEGDNVTKLHLDMTDAVNVLVDIPTASSSPVLQGGLQPGPLQPQQHVGQQPQQQQLGQQPQQLGQQQQQRLGQQPQQQRLGQQQQRLGQQQQQQCLRVVPAAVWDIFARQDVQQLSAFLAAHAADFTHMGQPVSLPVGSRGSAARDGGCAAVGRAGSSAGSSSGCSADTNGSGSSGGRAAAGAAAALWPLFSQQFMLVERHRRALRAETGALLACAAIMCGCTLTPLN